MDRKTAKMIRIFCEKMNKPYRPFKRAYNAMTSDERRRTKIELGRLVQKIKEEGTAKTTE